MTWRSHPLKYKQPTIPKSYKGQITNGPYRSTALGADIFLDSHCEGWKAYRYHFYCDYDLINQMYIPTRSLESIDLNKDSYRSVEKLAYVHGYMQCENDIKRLLLNYPPNELRQKLAAKMTKRAPLLALLLASLVCFGIARIPVAIARPNSNESN